MRLGQPRGAIVHLAAFRHPVRPRHHEAQRRAIGPRPLDDPAVDDHLLAHAVQRPVHARINERIAMAQDRPVPGERKGRHPPLQMIGRLPRNPELPARRHDIPAPRELLEKEANAIGRPAGGGFGRGDGGSVGHAMILSVGCRGTPRLTK